MYSIHVFLEIATEIRTESSVELFGVCFAYARVIINHSDHSNSLVPRARDPFGACWPFNQKIPKVSKRKQMSSGDSFRQKIRKLSNFWKANHLTDNSGSKFKWNSNSCKRSSKILVNLARLSSFLEILENGVPFVIENLRKCAPSNRDLWENLEGKPALVTTVIPTHVLWSKCRIKAESWFSGSGFWFCPDRLGGELGAERN